MPELPDVHVYIERLAAFVQGHTLKRIQIYTPFLLRTVEPAPQSAAGRAVVSVHRIGKRIVFGFEGGLFLVIHLMIAGRLRWRVPGKKLGGKLVLASFEFEHGTLFFTEAGTKRRAMLHVIEGAAGLAQFDRGGLEVLEADLDAFTERLRSENHTLKRSLTDPKLFSGIGNAYSDEILHRARLSPLALTRKLSDGDVATLFHATRDALLDWTERLRQDVGAGFPEEVTAFRKDMAVHGKYGQPCPVCGATVQRIRYASNETNYCARCQTQGRLLADRAMSQLLKKDWPKSIDDIE